MNSKFKKLSIALAGIMSAAAITAVVPMGTGATFGSMATVAHAATTTVTWSSSEGNFNTGGVNVFTDVGWDDEWQFALYSEGGTFTTSLGNFTKIEVSGGWLDGFAGTGWNGRTWTGNASSVAFAGRMTDDGGDDPFTITFTIESEDPATATYTQVGTDYPAEFSGDRQASLWKVTVTPGTDTIETLSVKVNGNEPDNPLSDTTQFSGKSEIVFGVVLNGIATDVQTFKALVNGAEVTTTLE